MVADEIQSIMEVNSHINQSYITDTNNIEIVQEGTKTDNEMITPSNRRISNNPQSPIYSQNREKQLQQSNQQQSAEMNILNRQESVNSNQTKDEESHQLRKTSQNFRIGKSKKNMNFLRSQLGSAGNSGMLQQTQSNQQVPTVQQIQNQISQNNNQGGQLANNLQSQSHVNINSTGSVIQFANVGDSVISPNVNIANHRNSSQLLNIMSNGSLQRQQNNGINFEEVKDAKSVLNQNVSQISNFKLLKRSDIKTASQPNGFSPTSNQVKQKQLNELYSNNQGSKKGPRVQKIKQVNANFINKDILIIQDSKEGMNSSQMKNRAQSLQNQAKQSPQLVTNNLFHTNSSYLRQDLQTSQGTQILKPNQGIILTANQNISGTTNNTSTANSTVNKPITAIRDNRNISTAQNFYSNKGYSTSVFFGKQSKLASNLAYRRGNQADQNPQNIQDQSDYSTTQKIIDNANSRKTANKVLLNPLNVKKGTKQDQIVVLDDHQAEEDQSMSNHIELLKRRRIGSQQQKLDHGFGPQPQYSPHSQNDQFAMPRALQQQQIKNQQDLILQIRSERKDFDYDESEDFHSQGIRIKINKERRVINHLNQNHENTNLLFYNFNAYDDNTGTSQFRQESAMSVERVPTRGVRSRKEFRERQIQSASLQQHPHKFMQGQIQNANQIINPTGKNNTSQQSTAANSISQKDRSTSNNSRHETNIKQSTYLSEVNAYNNNTYDNQKQKNYFNKPQNVKNNIIGSSTNNNQYYNNNSNAVNGEADDNFTKQAILTSENYGKANSRCFSSSNTRGAYNNQSQQNNNVKVTYNGPTNPSHLGSKTSSSFRSHKGPGGNFGRLTKINMKSVEDEIEEEMSSGEDEIFN
ncbi:UNKNOWN [Stylonychia lemnae]|uniref:Uncharacterized protein n=1 Tax=Stylonychia lemnae TaxID=5949 RepID=A0A078A9X0_STYLE|nr:UNKNOWN [Stylonychia lemnae]|eukprot:CDW79065.1 UNKNOWN [Stylonychia lemnae]